MARTVLNFGIAVGLVRHEHAARRAAEVRRQLSDYRAKVMDHSSTLQDAKVRRGCAVSILAIHETPTLTRARYEQVVRSLTGGRERIASSSDLPFDGLLVHAAGEGPNGFLIFDVFESERAVEAFRAAVGSTPQDVGILEPPRFFPAHTVFIR